MACSKYTLTNTGSTIVNFNYRRCDDSMWEYQVQLNPGQTKNAWVINGTLDLAEVFLPYVSVINQGVFPPTNPTPTPTASLTPTPTASVTPSVTPTNTPTPSVTASATPTNTPTQTQTPTNTQTQTQTSTQTSTPTNTPTNTSTSTNTPTPSATPTYTPTPTEPTRYTFSVPHSETSAQEACYTSNNATIFGNEAVFEDNTFFWACPNGTCPEVDLAGYYSYAGEIYELDSAGTVGAITICGPTPTPTHTPTTTPTNTPTPTTTPTYVVYNLGTGATSNDACIASTQNIFGSAAQADGPDVGETLYQNSALTVVVPNGFYSNGTRWYQVTGGSGLITSSNLC